MIKNREPLSMAESIGYIKESKTSGTEFVGFIKKFVKMSPKDAKEMRKKLEELKIIKIDDRNISKIIDLLPESSEELNKIVFGISLEEDETKKILDIVKEFK